MQQCACTDAGERARRTAKESGAQQRRSDEDDAPVHNLAGCSAALMIVITQTLEAAFLGRRGRESFFEDTSGMLNRASEP